MFSSQTFKVLFLLPWQLLNVTLQYYALGRVRRFRRYGKNLRGSLLTVAARAVLSLNIRDCAVFNNKTVGTVLREVAEAQLDLVKHLPNYGKRFLEKGYWLVEQPNREPDDLVLIYCHGGGYFLQINSIHIETVLAVYCLLSNRSRISILILDYSLASHGHTFPTQMEELYDLYYTVKKSCSRIGLLGDSAGGNLAAGFPQFLRLRSASEKDYPLILALVSPWLLIFPDPDLLARNSSYVANADGDLVAYLAMTDTSKRSFILGKEDRFSLIWSPATKVPATTEDWKCLPTFSDPRRRLFLLAGEDETLRDDAIWFAKYAMGIDWLPENYSRDHKEYSNDELEFKSECAQAFIQRYGVHDEMMSFERPLEYVREGKSVEELGDDCYGTDRKSVV